MWHHERKNQMKLIKRILLVLFITFVAIQFIQPARNESGRVLETDISKMVLIPDSVGFILKHTCYDCHSNYTVYPWYMNIQPMGWMMAKHIKEGKAALNFSEFGSYSSRRQISKLTGIENSIKNDIMPLASYTWMHKNARLNKDEKTMIANWVQQAKDSLSAKN
jgi:hypothetical protein